VLGDAGRSESNTESPGKKPYIKKGDKNDPTTLPMTTSIIAAASSPPAFLVITTLDAMVVGIQLTTTMPIKILGSMLPELIPPAAMIMRIRTRSTSAYGPNIFCAREGLPTDLYDWYKN
jgi:hypothetical protein